MTINAPSFLALFSTLWLQGDCPMRAHAVAGLQPLARSQSGERRGLGGSSLAGRAQSKAAQDADVRAPRCFHGLTPTDVTARSRL